MAKTMAALKIHSPDETPKLLSKNFTTTESPINPYITDGIPDNISIIGFKIFLNLFEAILAKNIEVPIAMGRAIITAKKVTYIVDTIKLSIDNLGGSPKGSHTLLVIKSIKDIFWNIFKLSFNININIKDKITMDRNVKNFIM